MPVAELSLDNLPAKPAAKLDVKVIICVDEVSRRYCAVFCNMRLESLSHLLMVRRVTALTTNGRTGRCVYARARRSLGPPLCWSRGIAIHKQH